MHFNLFCSYIHAHAHHHLYAGKRRTMRRCKFPPSYNYYERGIYTSSWMSERGKMWSYTFIRSTLRARRAGTDREKNKTNSLTYIYYYMRISPRPSRLRGTVYIYILYTSSPFACTPRMCIIYIYIAGRTRVEQFQMFSYILSVKGRLRGVVVGYVYL